MPEKTRMLDGLLNQGDRSPEEAFRMAVEDTEKLDDEAKKSMFSDKNPFEMMYDLDVKPCHISGSPDVIEQYTAYYLARKDSEK